jgi:hypothetical protein
MRLKLFSMVSSLPAVVCERMILLHATLSNVYLMGMAWLWFKVELP